MSQIFHNHASAKEIVAALDRELSGKNWIGDIALTENDFTTLTHAMRSYSFESVPPQMRIVAMVFTVRYAEFSDNETPNFWAKYAEMVWHQSADQMFQNREREHFRKIRDDLMSTHGLYFPTQGDTKQDVVSGIYLHAILPRYLQDDFARWLTKLLKTESDWQRAADSSIEDISAYLKGHSTLNYVGSRLRHFVEHEVSAPTAARLVQTLAIAGQEFLSGEESQQVAQMLSPIERDLWYELERELIPLREPYQRGALGKRRERRVNQRWAWNLADDTLSVVVKNWRVKSTQAPDRMVWAEDTDGLERYEHFSNLTPWEQDNDMWEVDSAYLDVPQPHGIIALVDSHDTVLGEPLMLSPLPHDTVLFFRLDPSGEYGILTPSAQVSDGQYVICSKHPFEVIDARERVPLSPQARLIPLDAVASIGHQHVERYTLTLPVDIVSNEYKQYLRSGRGVFTAQLEGHAVEGLSPQAIPIFYHAPRLRLINAAANLDDVRRLRVRVTSQSGHARDLPLNVVAKPDGNDVLIDLHGLTEKTVGIYELQLLRNFASALPERLSFALLTNDIRITSPDRSTAYTIDNQPSVLVQGITAEQVRVLPNDGTVSQDGQSVRVTWHNPHAMPHMTLTVDGVDIPLRWEVRWYHAWIDPSLPIQTLEDVADTSLHLRGGRHETFTLRVGDNPREVKLRADGCYDARIGRDALYDMLRQSHKAQVTVSASCGTMTWNLFEFHRQDIHQPYQPNSHILKARSALRQLYARAKHTNPTTDWLDLLALPHQHFDLLFLLPKGLDSVFEVMKATDAGIARWYQEGKLPKLKGYIRFEPSARYEASFSLPPHVAHKFDTEITLNDKSQKTTLKFNVVRRTDKTHNNIYTLTVASEKTYTGLKHCTLCGALFFENATTRIEHSHGQGWNASHTKPVNHQTTLQASFIGIEFQDEVDWKKYFSFTKAKHLLRGRDDTLKPSQTIDPKVFFTPKHYTYARAQLASIAHTTTSPKNRHSSKPQQNPWPSLAKILDEITQNPRWQEQFPVLHVFDEIMRALIKQPESFDTFLISMAILYRGVAYNITPLEEVLSRFLQEKTSKKDTYRSMPRITAEEIVEALFGSGDMPDFDTFPADSSITLEEISRFLFEYAPQLTAWAFGLVELYLRYFDFETHVSND